MSCKITIQETLENEPFCTVIIKIIILVLCSAAILTDFLYSLLLGDHYYESDKVIINYD